MEEKKKGKIILLVALLLVLIIGVIFGLNFYNKNNVNDDDKQNIEINNNDYIYKTRFDFGCESYIYLLENKVIKTVSIEPIYELVEGTNGYNFTGEYNYIWENINFTEETLNKVIEVFDELYKKSGQKEFNADELELNSNQMRTLLAVIMNDEDMITIEEDIEYKSISKKFENNAKNSKIENTMVILNNTTSNEIVNKIADYLNNIVNKNFDELNNDSQEIIEYLNESENLGVDLKIKHEYTGPYSLSFTIVTEGQLGANGMYGVNGYTFDYAGNIREFSGGWKEKYYKRALEVFKNSDLYLNNSEQLIKDWEKSLYDSMYLTGNWYLDDKKIVFLIPSYLLGFDEATSKVIDLEVDFDEEF